VVVCLNLVRCEGKFGRRSEATVKYNFGLHNYSRELFEMGSSDQNIIMMEESERMKSVGFKNIIIRDKNINSKEDIKITVRFSIIPNKEKCEFERLSTNENDPSDLIVEAGERKFKVHRNILTAESPVFAKLLLGVEDDTEENEKQDKILVIDDTPADTIAELLKYIYKDNCDDLDNISDSLLAAAHLYKVPGLKILCEKHLAERISPGNVAQLLLLADQYECEHLKRIALKYCGENHSYMIKVIITKEGTFHYSILLELKLEENGKGESILVFRSNLTSSTRFVYTS